MSAASSLRVRDNPRILAGAPPTAVRWYLVAAAAGHCPYPDANLDLPGVVVPGRRRRISRAAVGKLVAMARARTVAGYAIPGIILFFFWVFVVILAILLLAYIVHRAGGGVLNLRLGHFVLTVGFT